jgi:hypothetical protein
LDFAGTAKKNPEACKSQGDTEHIAESQPKASKYASALQKAVHSIIFGLLDDDELEILALTLAAHRQRETAAASSEFPETPGMPCHGTPHGHL